MTTTRHQPRTAADQALLDQLAELLNETTRQTSILRELRGLSLNDVLYAGTVTLDDQGRAHVGTSTAFASVGVWALEGAITVQNAPPTSAPDAGLGVIPMPAGGAVVWPLVGADVTIYGTAGDRVLLALWSTPQCPMVASGGGGAIGGSP